MVTFFLSHWMELKGQNQFLQSVKPGRQTNFPGTDAESLSQPSFLYDDANQGPPCLLPSFPLFLLPFLDPSLL